MSLHMRRAALFGAGSLLVSVPGIFACPNDGSLPPGSILHAAGAGCPDPCAPTGRGGPPFEVSIVDFSFLPNTPIIKPNTTVRWTNTGLFTHTTTRTPTWNSGSLSPNQFFDFTFTTANAGLRYDYICSIHGLSFGMEGVINVALFGDANLDSIVDLQDFNILAAHFGQAGQQWETGDFNEDGTVNLQDFNLLATYFGREIQPAGFLDFGAIVPEPGVAALTLLLVPLLARRRH